MAQLAFGVVPLQTSRMAKQPTILDVAKECGYSKSTVSLVLQGSLEIPDATKAEVQKAIAKLGYRYNRFAGGLRSGRTNVIGMLILDNLNPFYAELVHLTEELLREKGFGLIVTSSNTDLELEREALERLFDHQVDGIIASVMDYDKAAPILERFKKRGTHCVIAGSPDRKIPFSSVAVDFSQATKVAMEHLFSLGHSKIAFLHGAPAYLNIGSRLNVFKEALGKHKIVVPPKWIVHCGFRLQDGYEAAQLLLKQKERPTAIFALNDLLAIGVCSAAVDLGFRLPGDLSVIGVDNVEIASFMRPALTTVGQPIAEYAEALVNLVLEGIKERKRAATRQITLESEFVIRETTGPISPSKKSR